MFFLSLRKEAVQHTGSSLVCVLTLRDSEYDGDTFAFSFFCKVSSRLKMRKHVLAARPDRAASSSQSWD